MRSRLLAISTFIITFIVTSGILGLMTQSGSAYAAAEPSAPSFLPPAAQRSGSSPAAFTNFQEAAQAYSQLQEESQSLREQIEQARQTAQSESKRQAETFATQLDKFRNELESQRKEKDTILKAVETSNKRSLAYGAALVGVMLAAVMIMSFFQLRATAKLTSLAIASIAERRVLPPFSDPPYERALPPPAETERLMQSLEKLEQRLLELEGTAGRKPTTITIPSGTHTLQPAPPVPEISPLPQVDSPKMSLIDGVLGKGESLLQLGNIDEALTAFDEALKLDSMNVDAWVKKGSALERLDRMEEAVGCYDRAIELNRSSTLAYLYKGGVCNRLERFDEALACYEQALRSQAAG